MTDKKVVNAVHY